MIYDIEPVNNYQGNNSATTFDFDFYIENKEQLKVYFFDENSIKKLLLQDVDYTINEIKNSNGSYITFPIQGSSYGILTDKQKISLELYLPASQETQFSNSASRYLKNTEYAFDYVTRLIQILRRKLNLCVQVDECSNTSAQDLIEEINTKAELAINAAASSNENLQSIVQKYNSIMQAYNEILLAHDKFSKIDRMEALLSQLDSDIASKLNVNLSNLSKTSKELIAQFPFPSVEMVELTAANDQEYTAPETGWFSFDGQVGGAVGVKYAGMTNMTRHLSTSDSSYIANNQTTINVRLFMPVVKGDVVKFHHNGALASDSFAFIYAQGCVAAPVTSDGPTLPNDSSEIIEPEI